VLAPGFRPRPPLQGSGGAAARVPGGGAGHDRRQRRLRGRPGRRPQPGEGTTPLGMPVPEDGECSLVKRGPKCKTIALYRHQILAF